MRPTSSLRRVDYQQVRTAGALIALAVAFAALTVFNETGHTGWLDDLGPRVRDWTAAPPIRAFAHPMTRIGQWPETLVFAGGLAWLRARTIPWRQASAPLVALLLSMVVEGLLRLDVHHATVGNVISALTEHGNAAIRTSFPSGHMARVTVLAAFAVPLLPLSDRGKRWVFAAVIGTMIVDRLQFSGHTVSDLVGGIPAWGDGRVGNPTPASTNHAIALAHPARHPRTSA